MLAPPYVIELERSQKQVVSQVDTAGEALREIEQAAADGWTICRILREHTSIDMVTLIIEAELRLTDGPRRLRRA